MLGEWITNINQEKIKRHKLWNTKMNQLIGFDEKSEQITKIANLTTPNELSTIMGF